MSVVFLDVTVGETIVIGSTRIVVEEKSGKRTRLRIDSPRGERVQHVKPGATPAPASLERDTAPGPAGPPALQRPPLSRID